MLEYKDIAGSTFVGSHEMLVILNFNFDFVYVKDYLSKIFTICLVYWKFRSKFSGLSVSQGMKLTVTRRLGPDSERRQYNFRENTKSMSLVQY